MTDKQSEVEQWRELAQNFERVTRNLPQVTKALGARLQNARAVIGKLRPLIEWFALTSAAKAPLQNRGILPHRSTPWDLFNKEKPEEFPAAVLDFYSTRWDEAEAIFLSELEEREVSDDAKRAFEEALQCHRQGLYRASVLTLLPTIELEFRRAFEIEPRAKGMTSLAPLRQAVGRQVPAGASLSHIAPLRLFEVLDEHLYVNVHTQEAVEKFSRDPVPNRHAAIHGLVVYDSALNSLNAIILADYVFFIITQLSDLQKEQG